MTLISTKWVNYLHENEAFLRELNPKLFDTLYEYELKKFSFELEEGYRGTDAELHVFSRFTFTYDACQAGKKIVVNISQGQMPMVQVRNQPVDPRNRYKGLTTSFTSFFRLSEEQSDELQAFFETFGQLLLRV